VDALPESGFLLVTVRAGKVTTTINGQTQQRRTDDFWTVPENTRMSVEASGEAALLEVLSLSVR
jgi:quercetin dioxygenase-like cupin family protein